MSNPDSLDRFLKGRVAFGRKMLMPGKGTANLEFTEEFYLTDLTCEQKADELAERVKQKLVEWGFANPS